METDWMVGNFDIHEMKLKQDLKAKIKTTEDFGCCENTKLETTWNTFFISHDFSQAGTDFSTFFVICGRVQLMIVDKLSRQQTQHEQLKSDSWKQKENCDQTNINPNSTFACTHELFQ